MKKIIFIFAFFIFIFLPNHVFATFNPDLNSDRKVDIYDYNLLVSKFGNPYTIINYNNLSENFGK